MIRSLFMTAGIAASLMLWGCGAVGIGNSITVKGKVLVKGQVPRTFVALKVHSRLYYNLVGPLSRTLKSSYQNKTITIEGKIISKALGPGMPARLHVTDIVEIHRRR